MNLIHQEVVVIWVALWKGLYREERTVAVDSAPCAVKHKPLKSFHIPMSEPERSLFEERVHSSHAELRTGFRGVAEPSVEHLDVGEIVPACRCRRDREQATTRLKAHYLAVWQQTSQPQCILSVVCSGIHDGPGRHKA